MKPSGPPPRVAPLSPGRFSIKFTMGQETHDKLLHAQALLRHQVPSGELAEIFDRALDHNQLEAERVFGAEFMAPQTRGGAPA